MHKFMFVVFTLYLKCAVSKFLLPKLKNHSIFRYFENTICFLYYKKDVLRFSKSDLSHKKQIPFSCLSLELYIHNNGCKMY